MAKKRAAKTEAAEASASAPLKKKAQLPAGAPRRKLTIKKGKLEAEEFKVAKIRAIRGTSEKAADTEVEIQWFYRPTDTASGKRGFYGKKELFKSGHCQWVPAESLASHAYVHTLKAYEELGKSEEEHDFYARFTYNPIKERFTPVDVQVYCVCQQPYNPDQTWLVCQKCESRYHPKCVGIEKAAVEATRGSYVCSACAPKKQRL